MRKNKVTDLTKSRINQSDEFILTGLYKTGRYKLSFYDGKDIIDQVVNVVHIFKDTIFLMCGLHLILVEHEGQYQDFKYYDGAWEFNSNPGNRVYQSQLDYKCSDFIPNPDLAQDLEEFKCRLKSSILPEYEDVIIGIDGNLGLLTK